MKNEKIDVLNRREFVDRIIGLIESIAQSKEHRTFAIDGEWGSGKTWVLEEIEKELNEKEETPFLIIHYNCWEYDFYQEPLIAIVSALLDFVEKNKTLPSRTKGAVKKGLKKIGEKLLSVGSAAIKSYIGFDLENAVNGVKNALDFANQEMREKFSFDQFYDFKEILVALKKELSKLSTKYTVVLCVDELDRCLPEYAIKVLERLHHVFDGVENLQMVLSIDKVQLEKTVKTIFGESVNVSGYLSKFIDFTVSLPLGDLDQEKFDEMFADYAQNFHYIDSYSGMQYEQNFFTDLFAYTNIRRRIKIIEKAKLVHSLMPKVAVPLSTDYLAVEIFLTMASFIYENLEEFFAKEINGFEDVIDFKNEKQKEFWCIHKKVFCEQEDGFLRYLPPDEKRDYHLLGVRDTWGLLYVVLLSQFSRVNIRYRSDAGYHYDRSRVSQIVSYAKKFGDILKLIS